MMKISSDEKPINIQDIINFTKEIYKDNKHSVKMRNYALKNLDWSIKLKPVVKEIKILVQKNN